LSVVFIIKRFAYIYCKFLRIHLFAHIQSRFEGSWKKRDLFITLLRLFIFALKGSYERLFFKKSGGLVLVGKNASIRYAHYLSAGKDLIIEDGAEINCLSTNGIQLGNRVTIGKNAIIRPSNIYGGSIGAGLIVGDNSNIGPGAYIGCSGLITIGNNVMMSPGVSIYAENHNFSNTTIPMKDQGVTVQFVTIEDDCWIAANSIVLAGVTIGKGSVVAAGSIVTKDVPPYSVVAGAPAVVIKSRN
jgi:acetyltransferase-like isoleucine patch superfamily enzyme